MSEKAVLTFNQYMQLLAMMADEVNVKQIIIKTGLIGDGKEIYAIFEYDTMMRETIGIQLYHGDKKVEAPKTLLGILEQYFDKKKGQFKQQWAKDGK